MHIDPMSTDAFNALFVGHKWWVFLPVDLYEFNKELSCDATCSNLGPFQNNTLIDDDIANLLWFKHMLPQIR
jgi:hypothetical protein